MDGMFEDSKKDRKCLGRNISNDLVSQLTPEILGDDCALDLVNIDSICKNLEKFLDWAYAGCKINKKTDAIKKRCDLITEFQEDISYQKQFSLGLKSS